MAKLKEESVSNMSGILGVTNESLVSSDFKGNPHSSVVDEGASLALNGNFTVHFVV